MKDMYIIGLIYQNIFTGVFNTLYVDCNYALTPHFKNALLFAKARRAEKGFKNHKQKILFDANRYSGKVKEVRIFQAGLIPIETLADTYNFTAGFLED